MCIKIGKQILNIPIKTYNIIYGLQEKLIFKSI
jgi:hypothetical protein